MEIYIHQQELNKILQSKSNGVAHIKSIKPNNISLEIKVKVLIACKTFKISLTDLDIKDDTIYANTSGISDSLLSLAQQLGLLNQIKGLHIEKNTIYLKISELIRKDIPVSIDAVSSEDGYIKVKASILT